MKAGLFFYPLYERLYKKDVFNMAKLPLDKMAAQLEDIAKDITGEYERKKVYPWDRIADATTTIAEAVGADVPEKKYSTKKAQVADTINAIADADAGAQTSSYRQLIEGNIQDIIIPDGVVKIRSYAFKDCPKAKSILVPDSVKEIWFEAFVGLGSANTIGNAGFPFIGNGIEKIYSTSQGSFTGSNIKSVVLPSIKQIGTYAFLSCMKLKYIYLGPNCTQIEQNAFSAVGTADGCLVECGFSEGAVEDFPSKAGFGGNPSKIIITYDVPVQNRTTTYD